MGQGYFQDDTIVAIATAADVVSAIGIIRISGPCAIDVFLKLAKKTGDLGFFSSNELESHRFRRCLIVSSTGQILDDALFVWMKGPNSFTGEDVVELHLHGNPFNLKRILTAAIHAGARPALAGEFSFRAFRSGKIDLSQAEAIMDIVAGHTPQGIDGALNSLLGSTKGMVDSLKAELLHLLAMIEVDIDFSDDDRIGLLGSNGNGKSTFAKLVAGRLQAMQGKVRRSSKMKVGFFAQHQVDDLDARGTPYTHVAELMRDGTEAKIRGRCAQMGFPNVKADTSISQLSGGEKARLLMGLATFDGPHLLILDEPTNHLDIDSRAALIDALNTYAGAVILVSHDRHLLEACADRLWLVADGTVKPFDGDMDDYRRVVLAASSGGKVKPDKKVDAEAAALEKKPEVAKRRDPGHLRRKLETVDARIKKFGELLERIDSALADPDIFTKQNGRAVTLGAQRREVEKALDIAEEEWLSLTSELDEIASA